RASAALARAVYPDVAMGIYDPDEALDFIDVSRGVSVSKPRVEAKAKAPPPPAPKTEEEIEDAQIVEPEPDPIAYLATEDEQEADPRDTEDYWRSLIEAAQSRDELVAVGKAMADRFPATDHPIRAALRDEYARRQKELRGGAR